MTSGLAILVIGFFLGMRHAADPDHVIAVSTIVSREHSLAKAGLIGVLWGCGHTVTIVAVGAAIILFGLAVPVRVGLTMEFSVGVMLITAALALPFSFTGYEFPWLTRGLVVASGLLSEGFGLFVCYQFGFTEGLFTSHPNWAPS